MMQALFDLGATEPGVALPGRGRQDVL